jgi:hypothetical protein
MGWTIKGQKPGTYRRPKTAGRNAKLTTIVERNLWKIVRNSMKSKMLFAKRRGRFLIL